MQSTSSSREATAGSNFSLRSSFRGTLVRAFVLALGVAGCNTILDNQPGTAASATTGDVTPTQPSDEDSGAQVPHVEETPDAGPTDTTPPEDGGNSTSQCSSSQHFCNGTCVANTDPLYGCGSAACTPCQAAHGTPSCLADKCAVSACDKGYADCNQKPEDGCEVDLSKATSCGSCNAVCPAANPVCAPTGQSFQCTTGCTPIAPLLCGNECVSPLTSTNHCGACNQKCPDVANSTTSCAAGQCKFTCKAGYHACGISCAQVTDPAACGPTCAICPVPANAAATCVADACNFQCNVGFGNCNANAGDGCESNFATDPLNCGGCGKSCNGGTCQAGVCKPAADGG